MKTLVQSLCIAALFYCPFLDASDSPLDRLSLKSHHSCSPLTFLIRFHQKVLSPADGPRSHFRPSSSHYMRQSIEQWGALRGYILGMDRLQRENSDPWVYDLYLDKEGLYKIDPPPENLSLERGSDEENRAKSDLLVRILKKRVRIDGKVF